MPKINILYNNEKGMVLTAALIFLAVLGLVGSTAVVVTTTDMKIGGNYTSSKEAFYDAEAGVQYAISKIEADLVGGTLSLPSTVGSSVSLGYTSPTSFSFNLSSLSSTDTNRYRFTSTGNGTRNSQTTIEAIFSRAPAINFAAFGDVKADFKANSNVYSYDSGTTPNPVPGDSTGEGDIGSNVLVSVKNDTFIDGDAALGNDAGGSEATIADTGATFTGTGGVDIDRVDPDPLGVVGGEYADNFTTYGSSNDNALASPAIASNEINLGNSHTMTLYGKAGGANYYLTSVQMGNSAEIIVDASAGPVNIYLTGGFSSNNGAEINIVNGGPTDFSLFSNSTSNIDIRNSGSFIGLIYAPYAEVEFKNSVTVYGSVWAKEVEMKNSVDFYFDTALQDKYQSNDLTLISWRELRG